MDAASGGSAVGDVRMRPARRGSRTLPLARAGWSRRRCCSDWSFGWRCSDFAGAAVGWKATGQTRPATEARGARAPSSTSNVHVGKSRGDGARCRTHAPSTARSCSSPRPQTSSPSRPSTPAPSTPSQLRDRAPPRRSGPPPRGLAARRAHGRRAALGRAPRDRALAHVDCVGVGEAAARRRRPVGRSRRGRRRSCRRSTRTPGQRRVGAGDGAARRTRGRRRAPRGARRGGAGAARREGPQELCNALWAFATLKRRTARSSRRPPSRRRASAARASRPGPLADGLGSLRSSPASPSTRCSSRRPRPRSRAPRARSRSPRSRGPSPISRLSTRR